MNAKTKVSIGAAIYLLSPLDFCPDVIPILGWLDDIGVLAWAAWFVTRAQEEVKRSRGPRVAHVAPRIIELNEHKPDQPSQSVCNDFELSRMLNPSRESN